MWRDFGEDFLSFPHHFFPLFSRASTCLSISVAPIQGSSWLGGISRDWLFNPEGCFDLQELSGTSLVYSSFDHKGSRYILNEISLVLATLAMLVATFSLICTLGMGEGVLELSSRDI